MLNVKIMKMAGFFGVVAPVLGFAMIFLAIRASPWFSWTANALSDLGVSGFGSVIFNSGLAMTGALMMIRRDCYETLGDLPMGQDVAQYDASDRGYIIRAWQRGFVCAYSPAVVYHLTDASRKARGYE